MKICLAFEENTQDVQLVDSALYEGRAIVKDMDDAITDVDKLSKETEANEKIVDILGSNDNVSVEAIQLAEINLSSLRRKLNYQSSNVSVESVRNLKIALEEEKGILGRIWDMIKAVFKWIGEKISQFVNWVKGLFGGGKPKKAEEVIQKAADAKIQLKITAKPINLHGGTTQSGTESVAGYAVVSSETQQKVLKDQTASLQKALKTLDSSAPATNSNPLPAVRKIKEADKSNQVQEITSANVTDVLEKVVEEKSTLPLTGYQLSRLRELVQNKDEFIKGAKSTDLTEIAALRNSIVSFIKETKNILDNVNFEVIAENARSESSTPSSSIKIVFKEILSPAFVNKTFGKILSKTETIQTETGDEAKYTLSVNKATIDFNERYEKASADYIMMRTGLDNTIKLTKDNFKGTTVLCLASDVTFLSKNIISITEKLKNDIGKIEKGLGISDGRDILGYGDSLHESRRRSFDYLDKLPEEEKSLFKLHMDRIYGFASRLLEFVRRLGEFFRKIIQYTINDYHEQTTTVLQIADVFNKANLKADATVDWLTTLPKE